MMCAAGFPAINLNKKITMKQTTLVGFQLAAVVAAVVLMAAGVVARAHSDAFMVGGSVLALLAIAAFDYRAGWRRFLSK